MSSSYVKEDQILIESMLRRALQEDIGNGDVTTSILIPENQKSEALLVAKEDFIVAGIGFARQIFKLLDKDVKFKILRKDGSMVKAGSVIAEIRGNTRSLLIGERTALNLIQRTSGIASFTYKFVRAVKGTKVKITDTRKTAPGLRYFDKYAVKIGGGHNHRFGLFDGVLIKDNHIAAVGGVSKAVKAARSGAHHLLKIEVEVKNLPEVNNALDAGADIIMLDNMRLEMIKKAVALIRSKSSDTIIEVSGNITLENVRLYAEAGPDLISVGRLTHSASAADISLKFEN